MSDPWLIGPVTTTAYGWRLERRDGVTLGFTSHDRDVHIDGLVHLSSPGMLPSSILETIGFETDGLDVKGNLDSAAICEDDLEAGRWDGTRLSIYLFDWDQPQAGKRLLASGELGAISYSTGSFEAELRGVTAQLDAPIVPQTSPSCRATFCDRDCGLNQNRFRYEARVQSMSIDTLTLAANLPGNTGNYAFGFLRWLDGKNAGLSTDIIGSTASQIACATVPPFPPLPGARILLVEGCDKTIATCSARFGNAVNFRGEPYLPGNDLLTRYPGSG